MVVTKTLRAASGWLDLGLADEALIELQSLPEEEKTSQQVLEIRVHAEMECQSWNAASDTARLLCSKEPQNPEFFLRAAFCLHETGDTLAARNWLEPGQSLQGPAILTEPTSTTIVPEGWEAMPASFLMSLARPA